MKPIKSFAISLLFAQLTISADIAVAVAQAQTESATQQNSAQTQAPFETSQTPVTDGLAHLGIRLNQGYNMPCPGVSMIVYPKANDQITIETQIAFNDTEPQHPIVATILALIGYEPEQCGYFSCSEPKATKNDAATTVVSIRKPDRLYSPHLVDIKLRTLLNDEQLVRFSALLKARLNAKKEPVSFLNEYPLGSIISTPQR